MRSTDTGIAFIVGSPRSGTTILSQVLDRHPEIAQWYEPYFVWNFHLDLKDNDVRGAWEASPKVKGFVRREFRYFKGVGLRVHLHAIRIAPGTGCVGGASVVLADGIRWSLWMVPGIEGRLGQEGSRRLTGQGTGSPGRKGR